MLKFVLSFIAVVSSQAVAKNNNKVNSIDRNKQNTRQFWMAGGMEDKYTEVKDMSMKL
jgi:hypothetical protein